MTAAGSRARWTLGLEPADTVEADVVTRVLGMFNELSWPAVEGIDAFEGTRFHTVRRSWTTISPARRSA